MAYGSVVTSPFFDKMSEFLQELERTRGPIAMAMLTPERTEGRESWTLRLAASWLDKMGLAAGMEQITAEARQFLGSPLAFKYSGTRVTRMFQNIVANVTSSFEFPHPGPAYRITAPFLDTYDIEEAILFVANPLEVQKADQELPISA